MAADASNQLDPFKASSNAPNFAPRGGEAVDITTADYYFAKVTKKLYVSVAGRVDVIMADGMTVSFPTLIAGDHDLQIKAVVKANTAATGMVGLY